MKLLNESKFYLNQSECNMEIYLKEHFQGDKVDFEDYSFRILIPNDTNLSNDKIYSQFINSITSTFLNLQECKHTLYIPAKHYEISAYGEGFIDAFYPTTIMRSTDTRFITDDNEIGKNILYIDWEQKDSSKLITIDTPSLITINEFSQFNTVWNLNNGSVYKFLKEEIDNFTNGD